MTASALLKSIPVLSMMTLLGRSSTLISFIFFTPLYINNLGHDGFGIIGIYNVLLGIIGIIDGSLSSTFLRYSTVYASDGVGARKLRRSFEVICLGYMLVLILLAFGVYFFSVPLGSVVSSVDTSRDVNIYMALVLSVVSQILPNLYYSGMVGNQRIAQANFLQFLLVFIRTGGIFLVLPSGDINLTAVFVWYSFVNLLFILIFRFFLIRYSPIDAIVPSINDFAVVKRVLPYFLSMLGMALIAFISGYFDRVLLAVEIPLDLYGRWVTLLPLTTLPTLTATAVGYTFMPQMTELVQRDARDGIKALYFKSLVVCVSLALTIVILVSKFFSPLIFVWIGNSEEYYVLQLAFILQLVSSAVQAATVVPFYFSLALGQPVKSLKIGVVYSFLNVVLLTILVPKYGVIGASFVSLFLGLAAMPFNIIMLHGNSLNINLLPLFRRGILTSVGFGILLLTLIYYVDVAQVSRTSALFQLLLVGLFSFGAWVFFVFITYKSIRPIEPTD